MVFTNNHNTEDTDESCLVNCLSGIVFNDAEIIDDPLNNVHMDIIDDTLATVTSDLGGNVEVPELNLELFYNFEIQVIFLL